MTSVDNTLLSLLRLALGTFGKDEAPVKDLSPAEWRELIDMAYNHGVAAIAADALGAAGELPNLDSPEAEEAKYDWLGSIFQYEAAYGHYEKTISKLVKALAGAGVDTMLLKGYGLSLNYPVPSHRPTGDIDTYHFGKWREADEVVKAANVKIDYSHHHHSVFCYKGESVENHYDIVNRYASREGAAIDDRLKVLAGCDLRRINVCEEEAFLPSADFNGIFLLWHAAAHFGSTSITLRHVLDWALFVDKQWNEINWPLVMKELEWMGLTRILACMNAICIHQIGIDAGKFPVLEADAELERMVLEDILHPGFSEDTPSGAMAGFFMKVRRLKANMWKRRLVNPEPLVPMLLRLAWSHLRGTGLD